MKTDYINDFPLLLHRDEKGLPIAYLDNAATTQKPRQVIDAVGNYYENYNANPHRGAYDISVRATAAYEAVRQKTSDFIGAGEPEEIVFTSGATDSINLVAMSFGRKVLAKGDEILISVLEHHSNLLPWQNLARETGAVLRYLFPGNDGRIPIDKLEEKLTDRTKILSLTHVSNVLGGVNPIGEMTALAHEKGAKVILDAAQSVPHMPINVKALDIDFMAFSAHKLFAPAGVGVLYGKKSLLCQMNPLRFGGGIVEEVTQQSVRYMDSPWKFEAGTQNTEGVIGLGAAIDYLQSIGMDNIQSIEAELTEYAFSKLSKVPNLQIYGGGPSSARTGVISFNIADVHPHDTATILAADNIAVRAGHHCAQPLMAHLGVNATCRMSLCFYNSREDIDRLATALCTVREVLGFGA